MEKQVWHLLHSPMVCLSALMPIKVGESLKLVLTVSSEGLLSERGSGGGRSFLVAGSTVIPGQSSGWGAEVYTEHWVSLLVSRPSPWVFLSQGRVLLCKDTHGYASLCVALKPLCLSSIVSMPWWGLEDRLFSSSLEDFSSSRTHISKSSLKRVVQKHTR